MQDKNSKSGRSIRTHLRTALLAVGLLVGGVGAWAATTELAGALIAPGFIVVDTNVKKVQHPTGGVIGEIRVRDGDRVKAGDIVVRLDDTVTQANRSIVIKMLNEFYARQARLEAERDGKDAILFPPQLLENASDHDAARVMAGEVKLFDLRRATRAGQQAQLRERVSQLREEITGYTGQVAAKKREIELIGQELEGVRELWRKNLIQIQRVTSLERDATRLEGERGQLVAAIARSNGRISETELQIIQVDQELRSEVARELREIQGKISEYVERKIAAEDQLKKIDVRAPLDGVVHQLAVHTVGGVVTNGETMMVIVPQSDNLIIEVKVGPQSIDQVHVGQTASLNFSAFNQRVTPQVNGVVTRVSADTTTDQRSGESYYTVRISMLPEEMKRLGDVKVVPGMPVESSIQTADRTVVSFLVKPIVDNLNRAFRER